MPSRIVLATRNPGKVAEIRDLLADLPIVVHALDAFGCIELVETAHSFEENAISKATQVARHTGLFALADDSGLEVDYLDGMPGPRSARFAGERATHEQNNQKLLALMEGVPQQLRQARFRCVVAIAEPGGRYWTVEGTCEGLITTSELGNRGFGYDPLFFYPPLGKTFAQLDTRTKNRVSHRGQALRNVREALLRGLNGTT